MLASESSRVLSGLKTILDKKDSFTAALKIFKYTHTFYW